MSTGKANAVLRDLVPWLVEERNFALVALQSRGKKAIEKWAQLTVRSLSELRHDWRGFRGYAVGVLCGPSHVVSIDADGARGRQSMQRLYRPHMGTGIGTLRLDTPNGYQLIYAVGADDRFKTCAGQLAPGVDTRGAGGLIKVYDPAEPERRFCAWDPPMPLPAWLAAKLPKVGERPTGKAAPRVDEPLVRMLARQEGSQHDALLNVMLAAQTRYGPGVPAYVAVVYELAQMLKLTRPGEPWTWRDIEGLVKDGWVPDASDDEAAMLARRIAVNRRSR